MTVPISDTMAAMSCTTACIKEFFAAEPLIPARLTELLESRVSVRLIFIFQLLTSGIQLAYSLRYTLLPALGIFLLFFVAIFFTPPQHPIFTIHIRGYRIDRQRMTLNAAELAWHRSLQYVWPVSGWIEKKPARWYMSGCVVVKEGDPRWRQASMSKKEIDEQNLRRRERNAERARRSWVRNQFELMLNEWEYVGNGARCLIFMGLGLVCLEVF